MQSKIHSTTVRSCLGSGIKPRQLLFVSPVTGKSHPLGFPFTDKEMARFWKTVNKDGPIPQPLSDWPADQELSCKHWRWNGKKWEWIAGPCWIWKTTRPDGYGRFSIGRPKRLRHWRPHRLAYAIFVGKIPIRFKVGHHCQNKPCLNPTHLFCKRTPR